MSPVERRLASAGADGTVKTRDARPLTADMSVEREARGLLEYVFAKPLCKSDVINSLRDWPTIAPPVRQTALAWVKWYREEVDPALWYFLRRRQLDDVKFRRQAPIGPYSVDFVTFAHKLVIELDGGQHQEQQRYDKHRTEWLNSQGFRVLRYWNHEVLEDTEIVLEVIWDALQQARRRTTDDSG